MIRITNIVRNIASLVALCIIATSCTTPREEVLKVYNWGDYIDEELLTDFEVWYEEQTGEKIKVVYQTFDINEVMLAKIEKGHADFDVVCPSEYIIERMMAQDMLQEIITDDFLADLESTNTECYFNCISPYIKRQFSLIEAPEGHDPNKYAVGYMWGTTGILYNEANVSEEEALSWSLLYNPRLKDRILVKDAFRDVYSTMLIYARTVEAREAGIIKHNERLPLNDAEAEARGLTGKVKPIEKLMYERDDQTIAFVEDYLKRMKELVAGWEADFGKEMMTQNKADINLMWSGDAVWAIEEAGEVGVELNYVVPLEGSNVWFDGWVIPKYAKNTRAARYFINYMCNPENAIRNMEATGYVSVIGTQEILDEMNVQQEYEEALMAVEEELAELYEQRQALNEHLSAIEEEYAAINAAPVSRGAVDRNKELDADKRHTEELIAELDASIEELEADKYELWSWNCCLDYFFVDGEGNPIRFENEDGYIIDASSVFIDPIMYPDNSIINRCAMMHDSGEQTEKMLEMWSRVKGDNLSTGMLIGIILFFGTLIILGIWRKIDKYRKAQRRIKRRHHFHKLQKKVTNTQN